MSFSSLFAALLLLFTLAPFLAVSVAPSTNLLRPSRLHSPSSRPPLVAPLFQPTSIPPPSVPPPASVTAAAAAAQSFNETLSMRLLLHSSAAYSVDPRRCLSRYQPTFRLSHTFNTSLYGTSLFGYAGVDETQQSLLFAFQGSMDASQLWEELMHDSPVNITATSSGASGGLLVNQYFYLGSMGLLPTVSAAYQQLTAQYSNYSIHFTGHSLGGALAHVLSYLLSSTSTSASLASSQPLLLYTFGQPRTGNAAFASASSLYVPSQHRVVHWRDVIPHLPPCPTQRGPDGQEQCSASNASSGYYAYHAAAEVWYPSTMPALPVQPPPQSRRSVAEAEQRTVAPPPPPPSPAWTECTGQPTGEDEACSDGLDWYWIEDHYYYYAAEVGDFCLPAKEKGKQQQQQQRSIME